MSDERRTILIVDDDSTVRDIVTRYLELAGHEVHAVGDGLDAVEYCRSSWPELVVLDVMLPGIDGLEVCRQLRGIGAVPIIMLTARGEEEDRITGLELGADDYVTKPFSPRELTARVAAVLRRAAATPDVGVALIEHGDIRIEVPARRVTRAGVDVVLTQREFDLLVHLAASPGVVFRREELFEQVWGYSYGDTATITVHVRRLREKLEADPSDPLHLVTVWGVGYRWEP